MMEPEARRPRPAEYRNAVRALMLALRTLFHDAVATRRAVRTALEERGLNRILLALRAAPATLGTPRSPVGDPRLRELAEAAITDFALCRERRTRPLIREAADLLRPGLVEHAADRERRAADRAVAESNHAVSEAEHLRREWDFVYRRWQADAEELFSDPNSAVEAALKLIRAHGAATFLAVCDKHPARLGWMWPRPFLAFWRKRLLGSGDPYFIRLLRDFCRDGEMLGNLLPRVPTPERMAELQAAARSAAAARRALGPEPTDRDQRLWKPSRRASGPILDAMRLISPRHPEDAADAVRRQLTRMLPRDPGMPKLIDEAIRLAQRQDSEERRRGALGRAR